MERPLQIAILGCGWAGTRHARAYARSGAEIRWAVDIDLRRAEALRGRREQVRVSPDYRQALEDPAVDAVDICLPHSLHAPVAVASAEAGKHILCEKPIATTLAEADQMIEAAERAGVVLMIAENVRFDPLYRKIVALVQDGVIGQPALIQMTREAYLVRSFLEERRWFLEGRAAAGGIMMSGGIHDFEAMRMLIGEVDRIHALRARQRFPEMEGDDTSVATVRFRNGAVGTLVESFIMKSLATASGPGVHTVRIDGDLGSLRSVDCRTIRLFSERSDYLPGETLAEHIIHVPEEDTFVLEIEHFLAAIQNGTEPMTDGRSQRRPLEIVLAAYRSMQTGQAINLA